MKKYLFACPKCGEFYSGKGGAVRRTCDICGAELEWANVDYQAWQMMSDEERALAKKKWKLKNGIAAKGSTRKQKYEHLPTSTWPGLLGCCGWMTIAAGVIGGIGAFLSGSLLGALAAFAAGVLGASAAMTMAEAATDTRETLDEMKRYLYYHGEDTVRIEAELAEVKEMLKENHENDDVEGQK